LCRAYAALPQRGAAVGSACAAGAALAEADPTARPEAAGDAGPASFWYRFCKWTLVESSKDREMTDNELLEKSAVEAIRSAAAKLNVDPMRFARFLQDGRIANILAALGREEAMAAHRAAMSALTREYLEFLEDEMRLCQEQFKALAGPGE
jgi:hypothetical protein